MEQPEIHDEEASGWSEAEPDEEPTVPIEGLASVLEEPTVELPLLEWPVPEWPVPESPVLGSPVLESFLESAYQQPAYPKPAYPEPAHPEPAHPEPAHPEPAYPEPAYPEPASQEPPRQEPPIVVPSRSGPRRIAIAAAAAVLLLVAVLIVRSGQSPSTPSAAAHTEPPAGTWSSSAPRPAAATFVVADGAATIRFHTADLGAELYQVTAPGAAPQITQQDATVRLNVADRTGQVEIALASDVRWDVRIGSGVDLSTIDLSGARLHSVELTGGANQIDLKLPRPDGTLKVRMSGGVGRFDVHSADHVPVRVRIGSGASQVVLDGLRHNGVAAGALFTPDLWAGAVDRIDLDAVAGMSAMTVASY